VQAIGFNIENAFSISWLGLQRRRKRNLRAFGTRSSAKRNPNNQSPKRIKVPSVKSA
jgi:hypothetical protein